MLKPLIFAILALTIATLHVPSHRHDHSLLTHKLTDTAYIHSEQLTNNTNPNTIQSHLDLINNQLSLLEQSYKQANSLNDSSVIGDEGSLINCKNVTKNDAVYMKYTLENVDTDLWSVYFQIQQLNKEGGQTDTLAQQYQQLKQRKETLQSTSIIYCPHPTQTQSPSLPRQDNSFSDISQNAFISNLDVNKNWTYGKISQQQYQINQFQFLLNNDIVVCPNDAPFASANKCITCKANEVFFLDTANCSSCPNNTLFNNQSHLCQAQASTNCTANQKYNNQTKKCQCPSGLPYFDGKQCVGCFIPQYWNSESKKCQSCSIGNYYSIVNGSCIECPDQTNFISSLSSCHDQCTLSKPYFNGVMCISCPEVFNTDTKVCQSCPKELIFSRAKGICFQKQRTIFKPVNCSKGYVFNHENGQCIKQSTCSCPSNYLYNIKTARCQCPLGTFDTGKNCVNCSAPNTWNQTLKQCVEPTFIDPSPIAKVPVTKVSNVTTPTKPITTDNATKPDTTTNVTKPDTTTNATTKPDNATKPDTTVNATKPVINTNVTKPIPIANITTPTCSPNQILDNRTKLCICSPSTPYRTLANQCISCNPPNNWSETLRQCLPPAPICSSNFILDPISNTCICPKDKPFNNGRQCLSCYLPMYWSNLQRNCKYCPANQYFNPTTRKCESCPNERPLLVNHVCQPCQQGTRYNGLNSRCESIVCFGSSFYSEVKNDCDCPDAKKPFYNGQQCVACLSPNRWDLASRSCVYDSSAPAGSTSPVGIL